MSSALERLKIMMAKFEIEPKKSLGQNFLVSDHVIEKIVKAVDQLKPDSLIEIGPGLGALTSALRLSHSRYTLIELDRKFAQYWREQGLHVLEQDALQLDWSKLKQSPQAVLVSNLPYQISSSLVIDRSIDQDPFIGMVLMFQKEVAQRIRALPNSENYGMLSVVAQMAWKIEMLLEASSHDFLPPPKVASRVLVFKRRDQPLVQDKQQFLKFAKACFLHRRKLLAGNLEEGLSLNRARVEAVLAEMQLKKTARAQELSLQQFVDLFEKLR